MLKRIISGICLVAIAVPSLYFGGWLLYAVCLMVALIGNFELLRVTNLQKTPLGICAYAATIAYFISLNIAEHRYTTLILVVTFLVMMSVYVFTFPKYKAENVMWAFFGIIYVTVMIAYIYETRMSDNGIFIVWLIFIASWGNDTFAYFTGVCIGKHKMAPVLSPKKSVEGAIGGVIDEPIRYIDELVDCGADLITVHAESCKHLDRTIEAIKERGIIAGVALNPATPLTAIEHILEKVDMVLIMTVNPGFGGQKLIPYTIDKVRQLKKMVQERQLKLDIEVDGGVNLSNVETLMDAGANIIVAGSAVFGGDAEENTRCFLNLINGGK